METQNRLLSFDNNEYYLKLFIELIINKPMEVYMFNIKKLYALAVMLLVGTTSLFAERAPTFSMYQYKDLTFSTDTVYGEKVVVFIFGSIT